LRPSLIHGPFGQSWTIDVARRLLSGNWGQFQGHADGRANLVYVDDVAQAVLRALASPAAAGEAFNVNGPERVPWNDYFARFTAALGRPALATRSATRARFRTAAIHVVRQIVEPIRDRFRERLMDVYLRNGRASRLMKRLKKTLDTTPTVGELHGLFGRHAYYSDDKARRVLGYVPQFDLEQALALSVAWLRLHELTPRADTESAAPSDDDPNDVPPRSVTASLGAR
ncbi:MAG TPA: hypothetical protein VIY86_11725, partial [Pirellulaceae bacterium]